MFYLAGTFFGKRIFNGQHLDKKTFQGLVAKNHIFRDDFSLIGQGNGLIGRIVDQILFWTRPATLR